MYVLASISTISDVAPLLQDNRKIVKTGLDNFQNSGISGLNLLLEKKRAGSYYGSRDVAFNVSPTINAAGKFGFGEDALNLLVGSNYSDLSSTVDKLLGINESRKELVKEIIPGLITQAEEAVKNQNLVLVLKGLIASRLTENFQKPVIVVSFIDGEDEGRASCRSIDGFNMQEAIEELNEYHLGGGGHYMAAGFAIARSQYDSFVKLINAYAKEHMKNQEKKTWLIDGEFSIEQVRTKMFTALQLMEPFGAKNENALLKIRGLKLKQATYGQWVTYSCQIDNRTVKVYGNTEPKMGHIPTGKEIVAIVEIVFKEGQPLFLLKDFED
jgi:single-stranded-DNA-specific exonuclease